MNDRRLALKIVIKFIQINAFSERHGALFFHEDSILVCFRRGVKENVLNKQNSYFLDPNIKKYNSKIDKSTIIFSFFSCGSLYPVLSFSSELPINKLSDSQNKDSSTSDYTLTISEKSMMNLTNTKTLYQRTRPPTPQEVQNGTQIMCSQ